MRQLKVALKTLLCMVHGFFSGFYTSSCLFVAFNFHGVGNYPEGEPFIPIGIAILLTMLIIDILIIVKTVRSRSLTKFEKGLIISLFVIVKFVGLMWDQGAWANFAKEFRVKFMHEYRQFDV